MFSVILLISLWNDFHAFKVNSSAILLYSPSMAVLNEPIFGWGVARWLRFGLDQGHKKLSLFRKLFWA